MFQISFAHIEHRSIKQRNLMLPTCTFNLWYVFLGRYLEFYLSPYSEWASLPLGTGQWWCKLYTLYLWLATFSTFLWVKSIRFQVGWVQIDPSLLKLVFLYTGRRSASYGYCEGVGLDVMPNEYLGILAKDWGLVIYQFLSVWSFSE